MTKCCVTAATIAVTAPNLAHATGPLLDVAAEELSFTTSLAAMPLKMTFDGTHYYACSGGGSTGARLEKFDASGTSVLIAEPGLDCRTLRFRGKDGGLYETTHNPHVETPNNGVFSLDAATLVKTKLYSAPLVGPHGGPVFDETEDFWLALMQDKSGEVRRFKFEDGSDDGVLATLELQDPMAEGDAVAMLEYDNEYFYTFDKSKVRAYGLDGKFVGEGEVPATPEEAWFSLANELLFVFDSVEGKWRGFHFKKACQDDSECADRDSCTTDTCDELLGCQNEPIRGCCADDGDCDDADACNGAEVCDVNANTCTPGAAPDCADASVCTNDGCDPALGCTNEPIEACCEGDDDCGQGSSCDLGTNVCEEGGEGTGDSTGSPTTGGPTSGDSAGDSTGGPTTGDSSSTGETDTDSGGAAGEPTGGCGCRSPGPSGAHLLWGLVPLIWRRRRQ